MRGVGSLATLVDNRVHGMIARTWRTRIDPARAGDYRTFARCISLPMFRAQPGFLGVLFATSADGRTVTTLWQDLDSLEALERSPAYRRTVARLDATGILIQSGQVELLGLDGAYFADTEMLAGITR